ncbi:hypothetical protein Psfp_03979 [Pelotomaculum sp. FP]|uniref:hypothetical protein n=1 Tax=Pelotomaculum sp. FP TaxID=261474 RepID=UPI0011022C05|nr:hypothetical protein [Pelotomaculum sp. FP]TEB11394.1 hypothetical protein Psfp_03979 [Pelotomaculum sp. FP]
MKNAKKLLGLILAAVLAFSLLNTPALVADSDGIIACGTELQERQNGDTGVVLDII